mgnify:FL=1
MTLFKKNISHTPIENLKEFKLIDRLTRHTVLKNKSSIKGIGDDAAVIGGLEAYHLVSKDMLVEGVHFDLSYTPLKHLGYKCVTSSISDIYAMNGIPKQIIVGIAVGNRFSVEFLEEIYSGINASCKNYNIDLVGGDTTSSKGALMISITSLGEVKKRDIVYRSGANENDLLVCTGDLGAAYLGLRLLNRENKIFQDNPTFQPDLSGNDYVLEKQLKPEAGKKYIDILRDLKIKPTAMIDISDGLSSEVLHIAKSSNVGITIYEEKIPIDHVAMNLANELGLNPVYCALNGGEDYELLFTIKQKDYEKLKKDPDFTIIGHVTDTTEGNNFIAKDGSSHKLLAQGWQSF